MHYLRLLNNYRDEFKRVTLSPALFFNSKEGIYENKLSKVPFILDGNQARELLLLLRVISFAPANALTNRTTRRVT